LVGEQLSIQNQEENFVRKKFSEYYERTEVKAPEEIEKREWGFGGWDKKIESRHFKFSSKQELNSYLIRNTPLFISYSTAYYEFPDMRPMENKNWLGADLVFDLDSNHLELTCKEKHSSKWVCGDCLNTVKGETIKLVEEFLIPDFGFSREEIRINFSGNRGYHVHIANEAVEELGAYARREIVDFVTGVGIDLNQIIWMGERISEKSRISQLMGPKPNDSGWAGKIAKWIVRSIENETLEGIGINHTIAKKIYASKKDYVRLINQGRWDAARIPNKRGVWQFAVDRLKIKLGDKIDQNVTADATKLIRLPDSLHGETGLIAKRVANIGEFDPLKESIAFGSGPLRIKVNKIHRFTINGQEFGPFENEEVELPEYAALYLICKREAFLWKS